MEINDNDVSGQVVPQELQRPDFVRRGAMGWVRGTLTAEYLPPRNCRFFLIPHRADHDCDTAGLSYVAGEFEIDITQISYFMSIQLSTPAWRKGATPNFEDIKSLARKIFTKGEDAEEVELFLDPTSDPSVLKGGPGPGATRKDSWRKWIKWRQDEGRLVFWFVKYRGEPTMAAITRDLLGNRHWFTKDPTVTRRENSAP